MRWSAGAAPVGHAADGPSSSGQIFWRLPEKPSAYCSRSNVSEAFASFLPLAFPQVARDDYDEPPFDKYWT
jgi:hypothetical protein